MENYKPVRIILGSESDWEAANVVLGVLKEIGIPVRVSIASCHWHSGDGFEEFIRGLEEELIAYIAGMQFAASGIAETINKVCGQSYKIFLAVPTDRIAHHANQDFSQGTVVFMAGFNSVNLKHGLRNSALGIAKLYAWRYDEFRPAVHWYFKNLRATKPLVPEVKLVNGLIPEPQPEKQKDEGGE